ncbi:hypothetical protein ACFWSF_24380 [Streptomyces sp. NPDC058611]|uniref:hypothetical protein n=1 Tax=unclassified Streptomyces TaxID=2593676 RepID=UPI003656E3BC
MIGGERVTLVRKDNGHCGVLFVGGAERVGDNRPDCGGVQRGELLREFGAEARGLLNLSGLPGCPAGGGLVAARVLGA